MWCNKGNSFLRENESGSINTQMNYCVCHYCLARTIARGFLWRLNFEWATPSRRFFLCADGKLIRAAATLTPLTHIFLYSHQQYNLFVLLHTCTHVYSRKIEMQNYVTQCASFVVITIRSIGSRTIGYKRNTIISKWFIKWERER